MLLALSCLYFARGAIFSLFRCFEVGWEEMPAFESGSSKKGEGADYLPNYTVGLATGYIIYSHLCIRAGNRHMPPISGHDHPAPVSYSTFDVAPECDHVLRRSRERATRQAYIPAPRAVVHTWFGLGSASLC